MSIEIKNKGIDFKEVTEKIEALEKQYPDIAADCQRWQELGSKVTLWEVAVFRKIPSAQQSLVGAEQDFYGFNRAAAKKYNNSWGQLLQEYLSLKKLLSTRQ